MSFLFRTCFGGHFLPVVRADARDDAHRCRRFRPSISYPFFVICRVLYTTLEPPNVQLLLLSFPFRLQLLIDLVNHSSSVLPFESRKEIRLLSPSHDGRLLLVLDVDGRALLVNLQRRVVLHRFNFKKKVCLHTI